MLEEIFEKIKKGSAFHNELPPKYETKTLKCYIPNPV